MFSASLLQGNAPINTGTDIYSSKGITGKIPTDWTKQGGGLAALSPDQVTPEGLTGYYTRTQTTQPRPALGTTFGGGTSAPGFTTLQNYLHGTYIKQGKKIPGTNISNLGQLNQALFGSPYEEDWDYSKLTPENLTEALGPRALQLMEQARDWEVRDISRGNQQGNGLLSPKNLFSVAASAIGGLGGPLAGAAAGGLGGAVSSDWSPLGILTGAAGGYFGGGGKLPGSAGSTFDKLNSYFSPDPYTYTLKNLPGLAGSGPVHGGVGGFTGFGGGIGQYTGNVAGRALNETFPGLFPAGTPYNAAGTGSLGLGVSPPYAGTPFVLPPSIGGNPGAGFQLPDYTGYKTPTGGGVQDPVPTPTSTPPAIDLGPLPIPPIPGGVDDSPQPEQPETTPLPVPIPTGGGGNPPDLPSIQTASPTNYNLSGTMPWDSKFQERPQNRLPEVPLYFSQLQPLDPSEPLEEDQEALWDPFAYQKYMVNPYV